MLSSITAGPLRGRIRRRLTPAAVALALTAGGLAVRAVPAHAATRALAYIASVHAGTVSAGFMYPGETARSAREAGRAQSVVLALQCRYQGWARWMGCGGMGDGAGGLPSLADTIAAVRRELSAGLAPGGEQLARFRTGPVELDFGIAVTWTGGGPDGVQLSVLTLDSPGTATQRIKVTLQPSAGVGQGPAALSADEDGLPEYPARAAGLEVLEVADGLMVYQADPECVHHLNNTASIVFELCDGENTVPEISEQLAAVFGPDRVPAWTAEECIADLSSKSIVL
jgi:hypothetical protein